MKDAIDWALLGRYVTDTCSAEEEARVRAWMARDAERVERVHRLRRIWELVGVSAAAWDARAAWANVQERIRHDDEAAQSPSSGATVRHDRAARRRSRRSRRARSRAAWMAALVVVGAVGLLLFGQRVSEAPAPEKEVFITREGQRTILRLSDGTRVHLNADSRLALGAEFAAGQREVRLQGEAYFEVARDTTRPFRVYTEGATVRVLGTAFDVAAYTGEGKVRVAVTEGEVALHVRVDASGRDDITKLQPRSLGVVASGRLVAVHRDVDLTSMLAWTEGRLVFENTSFDEVARRLERWYGIRVEVHVPTDAILGLNATFEDEPLDEVLRAVAVALDLKYTRNEQTVTFYR